jgi:hypothetical protein
MIIGVDIGGTFTDFIVYDGKSISPSSAVGSWNLGYKALWGGIR